MDQQLASFRQKSWINECVFDEEIVLGFCDSNAGDLNWQFRDQGGLYQGDKLIYYFELLKLTKDMGCYLYIFIQCFE